MRRPELQSLYPWVSKDQEVACSIGFFFPARLSTKRMTFLNNPPLAVLLG